MARKWLQASHLNFQLDLILFSMQSSTSLLKQKSQPNITDSDPGKLTGCKMKLRTFQCFQSATISHKDQKYQHNQSAEEKLLNSL